MTESNPKKVAVVIAHSFGEVFESLRTEIQPRVWSRFQKSEIDVYYVLGNKPNFLQVALDKMSVKLRYSRYFWVIQRLFDRYTLDFWNSRIPLVSKEGDTLKVEFPEGHRYLGIKMIAAFKYLFDEGYEIIYRTTLSTVVVPEIFESTIQNIDLKSPFYGGTKLEFLKPHFVSGANLFLNRKSLAFILENINEWHHWDLDDVAIGKIMDGNMNIRELNSINVSSMEEARSIDYKNLNEAIHIRCKSNKPIRDDREIMEFVLRQLDLRVKQTPVE